MFEIRLKVLLFILMFALAIIVARLVDMQVVHGDAYRKQADDALLLPVKIVPAVRGGIFDRTGKPLATEEPCWDITVDYGILKMDSAYLTSRIASFRRHGTYGKGLTSEQVETIFLNDINQMWQDLHRFSGESVEELQGKGKSICERIMAIREAVESRRGFDAPVREERMRHAMVEGLDDQQQVAAREIFTRYPWVSVDDSTTRVFHADMSLAHVLGRLGPVTVKSLEEDPFADDPLRKYLGHEKLGITGVEKAAESLLRGRRGRFQLNREDVIIENTIPLSGNDIHLTIREDMQREIYKMFARHIEAHPISTGGSIVVLDVEKRECLALVSYPSYDPTRFQQDYSKWRLDTKKQPLRFRAVANHYAPGSIVKPLVCLAGLNNGKIGLNTTFDCQGALFPNHPDRWRCWAAASTGYRMRHGPLNASEAIKHSCNIFMYKTGQLVGVGELCNYFNMFGFGLLTGTNLPEEVPGINPTPSWLADHGQAITPGKARHLAIGQAEVSVTPLQAANLMAAYASGERRFITLVREFADDLIWTLPGDAANWRAIRKGLWGVVNDIDGTAHKTVYLEPSTGYAICGKTGSAEARPWPISYRVPYEDTEGNEGVAIQQATTAKDAIHDFMADHPGAAFDFRDVEIHERWPNQPAASGRTHSHAWFAGYLQAVDSAGHPLLNKKPRIAFAVMVEFGGSGGRASGPVARDLAHLLIQILGPDLDFDARYVDGLAWADSFRIGGMP